MLVYSDIDSQGGAFVDLDLQEITPFDTQLPIPDPSEPRLRLSESSDPFLVTAEPMRIILLMYDEKTADAEGFLLETGYPRAGLEIEDVTPGGAVRVTVQWAREHQATHVLRYLCGTGNMTDSLRLYDVTDF